MRPRPSQNLYELAERAHKAVLKAGFELDCVSRKTEARYYRYPGRTGRLRIATHGKGTGVRNRVPGLPPVYGKITFNSCVNDYPGEMRIADEKVVGYIAQGIGRFFMNSQPENPNMFELENMECGTTE